MFGKGWNNRKDCAIRLAPQRNISSISRHQRQLGSIGEVRDDLRPMHYFLPAVTNQLVPKPRDWSSVTKDDPIRLGTEAVECLIEGFVISPLT